MLPETGEAGLTQVPLILAAIMRCPEATSQLAAEVSRAQYPLNGITTVNDLEIDWRVIADSKDNTGNAQYTPGTVNVATIADQEFDWLMMDRVLSRRAALTKFTLYSKTTTELSGGRTPVIRFTARWNI